MNVEQSDWIDEIHRASGMLASVVSALEVLDLVTIR